MKKLLAKVVVFAFSLEGGTFAVLSQVSDIDGAVNRLNATTTASTKATVEANESQASTPLILKAIYGADAQQVDVTQKVRSLVSEGKFTIDSDTSLAGNDPAFGKVKTLKVTYRIGTKDFIATAREGESLTIGQPQNKNLEQPVTEQPIAEQPIAEQPIAEQPKVEQLIEVKKEPRLAKPGIYFLMRPASIATDYGITRINPGTMLKLLKDNGENARVTDGKTEFDVIRTNITNDLDIADAVFSNHQRELAANAQIVAQSVDIATQREMEKRERATSQLDEAQQAQIAAKGRALNDLTGYVNPLEHGSNLGRNPSRSESEKRVERIGELQDAYAEQSYGQEQRQDLNTQIARNLKAQTLRKEIQLQSAQLENMTKYDASQEGYGRRSTQRSEEESSRLNLINSKKQELYKLESISSN